MCTVHDRLSTRVFLGSILFGWFSSKYQMLLSIEKWQVGEGCHSSVCLWERGAEESIMMASKLLKLAYSHVWPPVRPPWPVSRPAQVGACASVKWTLDRSGASNWRRTALPLRIVVSDLEISVQWATWPATWPIQGTSPTSSSSTPAGQRKR